MKPYILLICGILSFKAYATATDNGLSYEFHDDRSCTLVSADCNGDVVLPETVSSGGIGYTLTSIGAEAFLDSDITSISLPSSITSIGEDAFRRCHRLEKVSVPSVDAWIGITFANEYASPVSGYRPLYIGDTLLTRLVVPAGVQTLKPYAFFNCSSLESADLTGLSSIGDHAFDGCENLASVVLSDGLKSLGDWAFSICTALPRVIIPSTAESLGQGSFYGCSSLGLISLPASLKAIPALCFAGCTSLENLDFIHGSVTEIGDYAFYFCTGLQKAILPESVHTYGDCVFYDCHSLRQASMPHSDAMLGEFMFANCYELTSVSLPEGIWSIPQGFFFECGSLQTVDLPATIEEIEGYAFAGCGSLRYIAFPPNLKNIGERAMYGCRSITRLEFPVSMQSIGAEAFYQCLGLRQIHTRATTPFRISFFSFDWQADREAMVYVPDSSLELYMNDTYGWANFDNLIGLPEYNPDTELRIIWGHVSVSRPVAYRSRQTLRVARTDGSMPSRVVFNGSPLTISDDGTVTTPEITNASTLTIE